MLSERLYIALARIDADRDKNNTGRARNESHINKEGSTPTFVTVINFGSPKRRCARCGNEEEFYPNNKSICKECRKLDFRLYQKSHPERNKKRWLRNQIRRYGDLRNRVVGGSCEICGKNGKLDVHHIDGNGRNLVDRGLFANNNVGNLRTLCRSCHIKIHRAQEVS